MNNNLKTIAAISTPHGTGGLGVIRVSGENAINIVGKVFSAIDEKPLSDVGGYHAKYGHILDKNKQIIDEVVVLVFRKPNSYTGENVVEISCHGGMFVTSRVLEEVLNNGAVVAQPGEFTQRAFLNGKLDLTQAEAVMDIISAKNEQARKVAVSLHEGALFKRIREILDALIDLAAHLSAWADYPDEDIPQVEEKLLKTKLVSVENYLQNLIDSYETGRVFREGVETAIVGKPNVGKSTLMNLLSGCERSIVTKVPGTTRDIIEETVSIDDVILRLSDTAGIHFTDDLVESIGVNKAKDKVSSAQLVLAVFDFSKELSDDDKWIIKSLNSDFSIAIINKIDLNKKIDDEFIKQNIKNVVYISVATKEGVDEFKRVLKEVVGLSDLEPSGFLISNLRQKQSVKDCIDCIKEAVFALDSHMTLDAVTVSIEAAIQSLLELTGERVSDAVVENVFSKFCVGK